MSIVQEHFNFFILKIKLSSSIAKTVANKCTDQMKYEYASDTISVHPIGEMFLYACLLAECELTTTWLEFS